MMGLGLSAWVARRLWRRAKAGRKREQDRQRDQDHHLVENKEA